MYLWMNPWALLFKTEDPANPGTYIPLTYGRHSILNVELTIAFDSKLFYFFLHLDRSMGTVWLNPCINWISPKWFPTTHGSNGLVSLLGEKQQFILRYYSALILSLTVVLTMDSLVIEATSRLRCLSKSWMLTAGVITDGPDSTLVNMHIYVFFSS